MRRRYDIRRKGVIPSECESVLPDGDQRIDLLADPHEERHQRLPAARLMSFSQRRGRNWGRLHHHRRRSHRPST